MARPDPQRRLIVNADDFGRSHDLNEAVLRAHQHGILTSASLMVNAPAADHAVRLAQQCPTLGVGLHLTLVRGRSTLKPTEIPGLVDNRYAFRHHPAWAGLLYYFRPRLRTQLRHEIHAQFQRFHQTGLPLDHVNGHLHLHLHPTILRLLTRHAQDWNIKALRLTRDPLWLNLRLACGRPAYRTTHALLFWFLTSRSRPTLARHGLKHTRAVFGLLQDGRVDEPYLLRLLPRLPPGCSELYCHPSAQLPHETQALLSPHVRDLTRQLGIQLTRYQDL